MNTFNMKRIRPIHSSNYYLYRQKAKFVERMAEPKMTYAIYNKIYIQGYYFGCIDIYRERARVGHSGN